MKLAHVTLKVVSLVSISLALASCSKEEEKGQSMNLPLVKPPVADATPAGLSTGAPLSLTGLSSSDFKSRFYQAGPTEIMRMLTDIDGRLDGINSRSADAPYDCISQEAVPYTITVAGQAINMYAQCYENLSASTEDDPKLGQFGTKDGLSYIYYAVGQGRVAAIVTPSQTTEGKYQVHAWMSVGSLNGDSFDAMSYGAIELLANNESKTLEVAVAGIGFGYCGAQLRSDGTNLYFKGSPDGANGACADVADLCVAASDGSTAGTCDDLQTFSVQALGRRASTGTLRTWDASTYPTAPNVTIDGTVTDDVHFGPTTPTAGVGAFTPAD